MAKPSKSAVAIQRLLDERERVQRWLERLDMASDAAPESVRSKVKRDYETRLGEILQELEGYSQELVTSLDRLTAVRDGLKKQETEAAERVAEAELRHAVGEFEEGQWRQVHAGLLGDLVKIREELKQAEEDIARVEEVVSLISPRVLSRGREPARQPESRRPAAEPVIKVRAEPPKRAPAPEPKPEPAREPPREKPAPQKQQAGFDELAFLRSVTEDEAQGPSASRASGQMRAVVNEPVVPTQSVPSDVVDKSEAGPGDSKAQKELKCAECGAMNLPTEWYCERCGAELAAL
ncbi:MAG TPA: hypothetical protein VNL18_11085 [Gemmatimonadales bacterium]|nr:hypothetical protein [Gemmatimonadales bacterium]